VKVLNKAALLPGTALLGLFTCNIPNSKKMILFFSSVAIMVQEILTAEQEAKPCSF
jgi:hypothetical protein